MESSSDNQNKEITSEEKEQRALRKAKRKAYYRKKSKKRSQRKKFKRLLETIGWILIILAFAATLFILMKELDIIGAGQ